MVTKTLLKLPAGGEQLGGSLMLTLTVAIPLLTWVMVVVLPHVTRVRATETRAIKPHNGKYEEGTWRLERAENRIPTPPRSHLKKEGILRAGTSAVFR